MLFNYIKFSAVQRKNVTSSLRDFTACVYSQFTKTFLATTVNLLSPVLISQLNSLTPLT